MRDLSIAYGNSMSAKTWSNKTITFDELKDKLKTTIRTVESVEEYAKFSRAKKTVAKDHGGFVGGRLKGGRRKIDTVEMRSMISLDGDALPKGYLDVLDLPYTAVTYTTHGHTSENPRARFIFPLTRDVSAEEYAAVARYLARMLGIDYFDECSYLPNQLMFWPSSPSNGEYYYGCRKYQRSCSL